LYRLPDSEKYGSNVGLSLSALSEFAEINDENVPVPVTLTPAAYRGENPKANVKDDA